MKDTLIGIAVIVIIILGAMIISGCDNQQIPPELLDTIPIIQTIICRDGESTVINQNKVKGQDVLGFCSGDIETFGNFIFEESK